MQQLSALFASISGGLSLDLVIKLVLIYFFVFWGALVIWVIKDVTNRSTSLILQVVAILLVLVFTPLFGLPIYLLIRPRSTIFEQYYENAELETLETEEQAHYCFSCNATVEKDFHYCPHCRAELRTECVACQHLIQKNWQLCPYCGAEQVSEKKEKKAAAKKKIIDLTLEAQDEIQKELEQDAPVLEETKS